jgi:hypothetical protein
LGNVLAERRRSVERRLVCRVSEEEGAGQASVSIRAERMSAELLRFCSNQTIFPPRIPRRRYLAAPIRADRPEHAHNPRESRTLLGWSNDRSLFPVPLSPESGR